MKYTEFSFIENIKNETSKLIQPSQMEGIGDDCAIIYNGTQATVITCDMLVENSHFLLEHISPFELGRKSAAVNLSDVASMGAVPSAMLMSIAVTDSLSDEWLDQFTKGILSWGVPLIGGDTTKSKANLVINITALGSIDRTNLKLRSMAEVGDAIYVTGNLGDSAAGLHSLINGFNNKELEQVHHNPTPHLEQGVELAKSKEVHAMMDISDGIASDLKHILKASNVSAQIDVAKVPMSNTLKEYCLKNDLPPLEFALCGGEDYSLLYTASKEYKPTVGSFKIGEIIEGNQKIAWSDQKEYAGFNHF